MKIKCMLHSRSVITIEDYDQVLHALMHFVITVTFKSVCLSVYMFVRLMNRHNYNHDKQSYKQSC